ncbi:DUF2752 domain-containing protein [Candidatus Villigracilis affinis]|uniref:DUF2752 domain-containing protein n=1 Tax=Candidatus Villigracilis affinis TaxID=3140682 RepID=UPI001DD30032|nr:DUF2752 domain-containing protein [Anaerolineales bacterium]MBL0345869.1 DUF2752 domain-containing protein [Anaerolineales bacterium]
MNDSLKTLWHQPVFSTILESRVETAAIVGFGVVHLGLGMMGLSFWNCPILAATGVPCPGCGLTRATMQLFHGNISDSLQTHAFAPIFLMALLLMITVLVLPKSARIKIINFVNRLERRNGITAWVFTSLMFYWAFRLIA